MCLVHLQHPQLLHLRGTPLTTFLFTNILFMNLSNPFELTDSVCFHSPLCQQTPGGKLGCSDKKIPCEAENFSSEKWP